MCLVLLQWHQLGDEGLVLRSPPPRLYNVIEVFQHINYVQNQNNFIKLVIMPYITELVSVSRNTLGNGNIN